MKSKEQKEHSKKMYDMGYEQAQKDAKKKMKKELTIEERIENLEQGFIKLSMKLMSEKELVDFAGGALDIIKEYKENN